MKGKVFKYVLPPVCIILLAAAAVWFQGIRQAENSSSPEDALQEVLGGIPDPVGQTPDMAGVVSGVGGIPGLFQGLKVSAEMPGENNNMDTAEPFLTEDLPLHDLYAEPGQTVRFSLYHPGASNYIWEYYDMDSRQWLQTDGYTGEKTDAQGYPAACADFVTPVDQPELMIRCLYKAAGGQASEIAYLRALPQEISQLSLADDITAEAGSILANCDTVVEVTYTDGSSDTIEGLYGLYFMESEQSESSEFLSIDGVLTEKKVQTTLNRFREFLKVEEGETTVTLAYMPYEEPPRALQLSGTVTGTDEEPPEIFQVDILGRKEISDSEDEISLLVTAEDNVTPYPGLQYAVIQKDADATLGDADVEKIADEDWSRGPALTLQLRKNSIWFLVCRDQAGNVTCYQCGDPPEPPANLAERSEDIPEVDTQDADTQAPVIRNIYVEAAE